MNVKPGPMLEKFAKLFGLRLSEVVEWVSTYVNHPQGNFPKFEATEKERFDSIKKYITWRIETTADSRIHSVIEENRREAA